MFYDAEIMNEGNYSSKIWNAIKQLSTVNKTEQKNSEEDYSGNVSDKII